MMAFSRVAYVCKCPTRDGDPAPPEGGLPERVRVRTGTIADVDHLPEDVCPPGNAPRLRARFDAGETFVVGEIEDHVVSCTWLRSGGAFALHHLPGRSFRLAEGVGYGYDAWTHPAFRGRGIRRAVFAEELRILAQLGCAWEVSYFVAPQIDGGRRNLGRIGVPLVELWKVTAFPDGSVALAELSQDGAATPCFPYTRQELVA
jgi:GNAT superfamily N-acetyltransferase